jgi:hypothetical protein
VLKQLNLKQQMLPKSLSSYNINDYRVQKV